MFNVNKCIVGQKLIRMSHSAPLLTTPFGNQNVEGEHKFPCICG